MKSRYEALKDANVVASKLGIQNLLLHFNENILGNKSKKEAERLMVELEEVDNYHYNQHSRDLRIKQLTDRRDLILKSTDWLFMSDVKTEQKHRRIYVQYRQYLRDLPALIGQKDMIGIEEFPHWLRRIHPEEFMDGGDNEVIMHRFMYYYK